MNPDRSGSLWYFHSGGNIWRGEYASPLEAARAGFERNVGDEVVIDGILYYRYRVRREVGSGYEYRDVDILVSDSWSLFPWLVCGLALFAAAVLLSLLQRGF